MLTNYLHYETVVLFSLTYCCNSFLLHIFFPDEIQQSCKTLMEMRKLASSTQTEIDALERIHSIRL